MIRWLPLTIVLLVCFSQGARAADGALFLNGEGFQDLEGHLSLWRDPSKEATLQEALAAQEAGAFSPIPGNLGLGYVPEAEPEARQFRLSVIRQATERLKLLFTLTLDRERKEEVGGPPSTLSVDLLLKDLEALCGPVLRERLRIDFAAPEAQVRADAREVGFALLNLVEGMAKATPRDSALTLRVSGERSERGTPQVLFIFTAPLSQEGERFSGTTFVRSVFEAFGGGFRWLPAEEGMQCVQLWLPEALQ